MEEKKKPWYRELWRLPIIAVQFMRLLIRWRRS